MTGRDWRDDARCRDMDGELFFPVGTTGLALIQIEQAKAVCQACPASSACLKWAIDTGQEFGVWGETSEEERRAMRRGTFEIRPYTEPKPLCARCGKHPVQGRSLCKGCHTWAGRNGKLDDYELKRVAA